MIKFYSSYYATTHDICPGTGTSVVGRSGLQEEKEGRDEELEHARTDQAVAKTDNRGKKAKKLEETGKASIVLLKTHNHLGFIISHFQTPELLAVEAHIPADREGERKGMSMVSPGKLQESGCVEQNSGLYFD